MLGGFLVMAADFLTDEETELQRAEVARPTRALENGGARF